MLRQTSLGTATLAAVATHSNGRLGDPPMPGGVAGTILAFPAAQRGAMPPKSERMVRMMQQVHFSLTHLDLSSVPAVTDQVDDAVSWRAVAWRCVPWRGVPWRAMFRTMRVAYDEHPLTPHLHHWLAFSF